MSRPPFSTRALALLAVALGCSSAAAPPTGAQLSVAGTYPTAVALVPGQNTCTGVTVEDNPTDVDHAPGSPILGLTHAGFRYDGIIQSDGQFTAGPKTLVLNGTSFMITMSGQFAIRGFTAAINVQATPASGPPCGYQVTWTATKQGSDNVIP